MGALPYVAYTGMCRPRWNIYYFKFINVYYTQLYEAFTYSQMCELVNVE